MQMKHLIIFAIAGIILLIGFNMMNSDRRDDTTAVVDKETTESAVVAETYTDANTESKPSAIADKPLGQQPKAIIDKATTQIEQAEQDNQEQVKQIEDAL